MNASRWLRPPVSGADVSFAVADTDWECESILKTPADQVPVEVEMQLGRNIRWLFH